MEVLQQAYPNILEGFLESALNDAGWDVIDALESLRLSLGTPTGPREQGTGSLPDNGISLNGGSRHWREKQRVEAIQPESSKDDVWSLN
jgi:hypothetical protein